MSEDKTAQKVEPTKTPILEAAVLPDTTTKKTSGLAIAALILAFLFPLIGLILGIVALSSIKKNNEGGKGLATASIIIALVIMFIQVFAVFAIIAGVQKGVKDSGLNVDGKTGSVSVQGKDGESVSVGNTKVPQGFPSDVPIYQPSDVILAIKTKEGYNVTLATNDDSQKVLDFYTSKLSSNGWSKSENEFNFEAGSAQSFTKGSNQLVVLIGTDNKSTSGKKTTVNLTVAPKTSESSN